MPSDRLVNFLGVNLRRDPSNLRDEDVARAINADLHTKVGTAMLRKGRSRLYSVDGSVRGLARFGTDRYALAGTALYKNGSSLVTGLHSDRRNTLLAMRPLSDPTTWVFIADQTTMQKEASDTVVGWGITAPTSAPTLAAGAASSLSGVYKVKYTYARQSGDTVYHESNPSDASNTLTVTSTDISVTGLTDSTDPQVTHKRLYRTVNSGSTYLFHGWVIAGTPTSTMGLADSALGAALEEDNDPPPDSFWATAHQEHVFFLDPRNPSYLWWSKRYRPESVPSDNYLDIGTADNPLNGLVSMVGLLGVFTPKTKYRILGNATSGFVHQEALSSRGTPAPRAALVTEQGCFFPARDGLFLTNFVQADQELSQLIAPIFEGVIVNDYLPINWNAASAMTLGYWKQRLYFAYPSEGSTDNDMVAVYSFHTQQWYFYQMRCSAFLDEESTGLFLSGTDGGDILSMETGADDDGNSISYTFRPATRFLQVPFNKKAFTYLRIDASVSSGTLVGRLYVDGVVVKVLELTGSETRRLQRLSGVQGYEWYVELTYVGTGTVEVFGVEVQAIPLGSA